MPRTASKGGPKAGADSFINYCTRVGLNSIVLPVMENVKLKIALSLALVVLLANEASAALSGFWDSSRILHAVLGNSAVADALKQQPIEFVSRTQTGFTIKSRDCTVDVIVDLKHATNPGPGDFNIRVGKNDCR